MIMWKRDCSFFGFFVMDSAEALLPLTPPHERGGGAENEEHFA